MTPAWRYLQFLCPRVGLRLLGTDGHDGARLNVARFMIELVATEANHGQRVAAATDVKVDEARPGVDRRRTQLVTTKAKCSRR